MSLLSNQEKFDLNIWIEQLKKCNPLSTNQIKILCEKVNHKSNNAFKIIGKRNFRKRAKCS